MDEVDGIVDDVDADSGWSTMHEGNNGEDGGDDTAASAVAWCVLVGLAAGAVGKLLDMVALVAAADGEMESGECGEDGGGTAAKALVGAADMCAVGEEEEKTAAHVGAAATVATAATEVRVGTAGTA